MGHRYLLFLQYYQIFFLQFVIKFRDFLFYCYLDFYIHKYIISEYAYVYNNRDVYK